jgi:DNA replication protein DnaC
VEAEALAKTESSIQRRIERAKFPWIKRLEEFDFGYQPSYAQKKRRV